MESIVLLGSALICFGRLSLKSVLFGVSSHMLGSFVERNPIDLKRSEIQLTCCDCLFFTFEWLNAYLCVESVLMSVISYMSSIESLGPGPGVSSAKQERVWHGRVFVSVRRICFKLMVAMVKVAVVCFGTTPQKSTFCC